MSKPPNVEEGLKRNRSDIAQHAARIKSAGWTMNHPLARSCGYSEEEITAVLGVEGAPKPLDSLNKPALVAALHDIGLMLDVMFDENPVLRDHVDEVMSTIEKMAWDRAFPGVKWVDRKVK